MPGPSDPVIGVNAPKELELLNLLWRLVSIRLNFFTPTRKAVGTTVELDTNRNPWCAHLPNRYTSKMVALVVCELP